MTEALVVSVVALKGGVGKSTIALNLADAFHQAGHRVMVVDSDPQGTAREWAATAAANEEGSAPVVSMNGAALARDLRRVAEGWDLVIVDTPPRLGAEARAAMGVASLVLLPVSPGPSDVWALRDTLNLLTEARGFRPELPAGVVLNRVSPRTALSASLREAAEASGIPVLASVLTNRVSFPEAVAVGKGAITYAPGTSAAREIEALATEAMEMLQ